MTLAEYPGHGWAILLLTATAAAMIFAYRSRQLQSAKIMRWILAILQYAVIVALLVIIWDPSNITYSEDNAANSVLVFFDTSESMSIADHNGQTRLDYATELYRRLFPADQPDRPRCRIYGFDRTCYRSDSVEGLKRWGDRTAMDPVIRNIVRQRSKSQDTADSPTSSDHVVGAVVFTDGQASDKNTVSTASLSGDDFKVIFVGMGQDQQHQDIAVTSLEVPTRVILDTAYQIKATLGATLVTQEVFELTLLKDGVPVDRREITIHPKSQATQVAFDVIADTLGEHTLDVQISASADEINLRNNSRCSIVHVVENPVLKVLFYTQVMNHDFGKIRSALERDKKVKLDIGCDAIIPVQLSRTAKQMAGHIELPTSKEGFYAYDVIILGPCEFDAFTDEQLDGLYRFVVDRGGGLLLLPGRGPYDVMQCRHQPLRLLSPMISDHNKTVSTAEDEGVLTLTVEGLNSAILRRDDMKDDHFVQVFYPNAAAKPAGMILADAAEKPVICLHRVGRGHVGMVNTYGLYQLYREDDNGGLLLNLMSGLVGYIGRNAGTQAGVELFGRLLTDQPGVVRFEAYVYDALFKLVSDATALLRIGSEQHIMQEADAGHYQADIYNAGGGSLTASVEAEKKGVFLGERSLVLNLNPPHREMDQVERDRHFLESLAEKTHAVYVDADQCDASLVADFDAVRTIQTAGRMHRVWPCWPVLIALCAALTAIWTLRRAKGLI